MIFTLFHHRNRISSQEGINHWIPFREREVGAKAKYQSDFMVRFLEGQSLASSSPNLLSEERLGFRILDHLSAEAKAVYEAGLRLWKHYHAQPDAQENASLYDIKAYFQGRDPSGKMKSTSLDPTYNTLSDQLREALDSLAQKLLQKAYEYSFLRR